MSLVLVLAMALSMFGVCASATDVKDYSDYDDITYVEAVGVLSGLGVLQGDDRGFAPKEGLDRSEAAKIAVYLLGLQDEVTDGPSFTDLDGCWAKSVIAVAESQGLVAGVGGGKYEPEGSLTGYQWEKMVLCALGYDAEVEGLVGPTWQGNVQALAKKLNLTAGLVGYDATKDITREEAAQIAFNALNTKMVEYDYTVSKVESVLPYTLGQHIFHLEKRAENDKWGRPGYKYVNSAKDPMDPTAVYYSYTLEPVAEFTVAKTQCDIATAMGLNKKEDNISVFDNGEIKLTGTTSKTLDSKSIDPTDRTSTYGAQGRLVQIYDIKDYGTIERNKKGVAKTSDVSDKYGYEEKSNYRAVVIDTYLAQVTAVKDATFDANGHEKTPATITLKYFNTATGSDLALKGGPNFPYVKGEYVLLNKHAADNATNAAELTTATPPSQSDILCVADAAEGVQTKLAYNTNTHIIDGVTYPDAEMFFLDEARLTTKVAFTWFYDQYKNVIGSKAIYTASEYAAITSIELIDAVGEADYVVADLIYMDGTTEDDVVVDAVNCYCDYHSTWHDDTDEVYYDSAWNTEFLDDLYKVEVGPSGKYTLTEVKEESDVNIEAGVPTKLEADGTPYTDNTTMYLFRLQDERGNFYYETATGYENVYNYKDNEATVDYVAYNNKEGYDTDVVKYAFVTGIPDKAIVRTADFVFFNNDKYTLDLEKVPGEDAYLVTIENVLDFQSESNTLTVKYATTETDRATVLNAIAYKLTNDMNGKLWKYEATNGVINGFDAFEEVDDNGLKVQFGPDGYTAKGIQTDDDTIAPKYNADSGVLTIDGKAAYNVNKNTTFIVNDDEVLEASELTTELMAGKNLYVVTKDPSATAAVALFITDEDIKEYEEPAPATTYAVTINGTEIGKFEAGTVIDLAKQIPIKGTGTGVKVVCGDSTTYASYTDKITVAGATTITSGFVAWTLNDGEPVPVEYGTQQSAKSVFSDVSGTYVHFVRTGDGVATDKNIPVTEQAGASGNVAIEDGFYKVTVDSVDTFVKSYSYENATTKPMAVTVNDGTNEYVYIVNPGAKKDFELTTDITVTIEEASVTA